MSGYICSFCITVCITLSLSTCAGNCTGTIVISSSCYRPSDSTGVGSVLEE